MAKAMQPQKLHFSQAMQTEKYKNLINNTLGDPVRAARFAANITSAVAVMIRILLSKRLGELKWTQADLARATGIRPTTISDYYNEIAERINLNHLDLICEALDCSPTEILVREPNPEPRVRNRTGFEKPVADQRKDGE